MIIFFIISIWKLHWIWIFGCILAIFVSFIPTILKRNYQITLPLVLDILITFSLLLHVGGGLLGAYNIPNYDTLTHFISSFLVAFLAFVIIYILHVYWDGLIMDKYAMAFLVIITTIAIGVVWEFNEWITDLIFKTTEQWGYEDTLKDLFIDTIAGIIMAIIGVTMIKRGSFDEMTGELGKQIDKRIIKSKRKGKNE
ncbi:hypothetical protein AYK21_05950 [Thermoplasmatales archaeon SG8-52-2]|nr:MAG: hypothetical protein AYK21_05950 [Thermoplasmatales archaeon SG8-52-2]